MSEAIPLLTLVTPSPETPVEAAGAAALAPSEGTDGMSGFPLALAGQLAGAARKLGEPAELAESGKDLPPVAAILAILFSPIATGEVTTPEARATADGEQPSEPATATASDLEPAAAIALQIPRHPAGPGAAGILPPEADAPLEPIADADRAAQAARIRLALETSQSVAPDGSGAETDTPDRLFLTMAQPAAPVGTAVSAMTTEASTGPQTVRSAGAEATTHSKIAQALELPLTDPQWGSQLGNRVLWLVNHDVAGAQLRLDPPELGPLAVQVQIEQDQASIQFSAAHAPVREAIENALPQLREMLRSSGLQLADVNVSAHGFAEGRHAPAPAWTPRATEDDETAALSARLAVGLVDLYA